MTFRVLWTPTAEQNLAAVWIGADDRNAVTSAANTIDSLGHDQGRVTRKAAETRRWACETEPFC
jgi:hypothetical protein